MNGAEEMEPREVIERYRNADVNYKLAMAKATIKHRGEGSERLVEALALVDCEAEFRVAQNTACEFESMRAEQEERVLQGHDAAAEYHRSWATRKTEWAE